MDQAACGRRVDAGGDLVEKRDRLVGRERPVFEAFGERAAAGDRVGNNQPAAILPRTSQGQQALVLDRCAQLGECEDARGHLLVVGDLAGDDLQRNATSIVGNTLNRGVEPRAPLQDLLDPVPSDPRADRDRPLRWLSKGRPRHPLEKKLSDGG